MLPRIAPTWISSRFQKHSVSALKQVAVLVLGLVEVLLEDPAAVRVVEIRVASRDHAVRLVEQLGRVRVVGLRVAGRRSR